MSKYCPNCQLEFNGKFCPECGTQLIEKPAQAGGINVNLGGDANAISGGLNLQDSHNVSTVNTVTNNVTNIAPQKSDMEILQDKKNSFLAECKRAFEDGILEPAEEVALEECRIKLGLDEATAKGILDKIRLLADKNSRKTSLNPIAKTKLKILSDNLQKNNVPVLKDQIKNLEAIVNRYEHDELSRKYFLALAVLEPRKCIEMRENSSTDSYWKSYWSYLAYIKENEIDKAEALLAGLDRFADYPEDNLTILATAGAIMAGSNDEAMEYLSAVTGDFTPELQRFVDSVYLILDPETAKEMGADPFACTFYLVNMFGQKDPKVAAAEEAERRAKEEAERKAREEAEKRAKEEAERKAREEAERRAKEEAERKAREEAEKRVREEAKRKAAEEAELRAKKIAERKARMEFIQKEAPFRIYLDKVDDLIPAMMTARSLLGWSSTEFRKNTSAMPALALTANGRVNATAILSQLNRGGLTCHIESDKEYETLEGTDDSEITISYPPCTDECSEATNYAFGLNGKELDITKAVGLWKAAALKEDPRALSDYGICLGSGIGIKKDIKGAAKNLKKAIGLVLPKAKEGDKDSMLFIARCAFMGMMLAQSDKESMAAMQQYVTEWSAASAKEGNVWAKVLRYSLDNDSIDAQDKDYIDNILTEIKAGMQDCPIYADALLLIYTLCDDYISKKQLAEVNKLSKEALGNHQYSNDLVAVLMAAGVVQDGGVPHPEELLSYYAKLDVN